MAGYRILDEPSPTTLGHLVVQPLWPLFSLMFAGIWLAFPWFCFNAVAMGCPNRKRTFIFAAIGLVGKIAIILALVVAAGIFQWDEFAIRYAMLVTTVWDLGIGYYLFVLQSRTFDLYTHFGGRVRNGLILVIAGAVLSPNLIGALPSLIQLVLR